MSQRIVKPKSKEPTNYKQIIILKSFFELELEITARKILTVQAVSLNGRGMGRRGWVVQWYWVRFQY